MHFSDGGGFFGANLPTRKDFIFKLKIPRANPTLNFKQLFHSIAKSSSPYSFSIPTDISRGTVLYGYIPNLTFPSSSKNKLMQRIDRTLAAMHK
jgi:hypothetical protein